MEDIKSPEQALTMADLQKFVGENYQLQLAPSAQGMIITITNGPFEAHMIKIPAQAMTQAAKAWGIFLKQQADEQRALANVRKNLH